MTTQNLLVFGASGPTGRQVVTQALTRGYRVTAFVRDPARFPVNDTALRVVRGDTVEDPQSVRSALQGQDAVISTLGVGKSFASRHLIEQSMASIVREMESAGVKRLVLTSAFGVGSSWADTPLVPRLFIKTLLRDVYADKHAGEVLVHRSRLDWTVVYPTGLTDRPATGVYRAGEHLELRGFPTISRADVAHFLVAQVGDPTYLRKAVLVTSPSS